MNHQINPNPNRGQDQDQNKDIEKGIKDNRDKDIGSKEWWKILRKDQK